MAARLKTVTIALLLVPSLAACGGGETPTSSTSSTTAQTPSASASPSPSASSTPSQAVRPEVMLPGSLQSLWPFTSLEEVRSWQQSHRSGGHSPWHLDAAQTALSFSSGFLGFKEIDQVTSGTVTGDDARIGVGARTEGDLTSTAAVIHLRRVGTGNDRPWEVVGTDDTDLTLTSPAYGSNVTSPVKVGGKITGVDESIRIQIRRASTKKPVGTSCCLSAGGERTPWSAQVTFTGTSGQVLTIVASTGGHLAEVERFAVTGVTG